MRAPWHYATFKTIFMKTLNDRGKCISSNAKERIQDKSNDINPGEMHINMRKKHIKY